MKIQVLVATMHQEDHSILEKLNIQSDAIVANQCDDDSVECFSWEGNNIIFINSSGRGVGLNRNMALIRAACDVCLFADDDMYYVDNYPAILEDAFGRMPNADVIVFNLIEEHAKGRKRPIIKTIRKVNYFNFLRYGTVRIACRFKSIKENGIYFNQCFGGGCEYLHGEDNIFIADCLRKGLKVYGMPIYLAALTEERESTWIEGYTDRYFLDQGKLYRTISRKWWMLLCLQDSIRHQKQFRRPWVEAFRLMIHGGLA